MKIAHAPTEIAGQMGILTKQLRKKGHKVAGFNGFHTFLNYKNDILNTDAFEILKDFQFLIDNVEIFHFYNTNTFLTDFADIPLLKAKGKKLIMHHWGSDVRKHELVKKLNPYPLPPTYYSDEEIDRQLSFLSQFIDVAIVQDYEAYQYVKDYYKKVYILPLACNLEDIEPAYPSVTNNDPLIIHAPTNRAFKGSEYVEKAIEKIKGKSTFSFRLLEKVSHEQAMQTYMKSDIIIDQLLCGSYGMLSVEAMAMGKPVIAYIREDVRNHFPVDLPIVQATPENIDKVLLELVQNPSLRNQIGMASRQYVEKYHSVEKVVMELIKVYEAL
ncbi:glycosyltransferase [Bacillus sp. FJAT-49736]|uniref:glycosyltransferase family protein n=1 Tax=Bacillus sp. FJAT-49736 TaxID=2833582 RepID=UPI001BC9855D|nr:glycosyltransferase [Bacillus sp. FJAT-49736]MBS4172215.1 glycosyltransferase family 4 protein [Bacillus sp. FJAT-49736]